MIRTLSTIAMLLFMLPCFGQGQSGRPMVSVDTVADLVARNPVPNERVLLSGLRTAGDFGAQRIVRHVPDSVAATNLGCVYANAGSGRYLAEDCESGNVNARWFGAKGDAKANNVSVYEAGTDDTSAIQAAIDYAVIYGGGESGGATVVIPAGTYRITSPLLVQRRDDTFTRLGLTNSDTNSTYWNDRPRVKIRGDYHGSLIVSTNVGVGMLYIAGKTNYSGYVNRIQNVEVEDINFHHMDSSVGSDVISIFNSGHVQLNRVRTRGGYISLRLSASSEMYVVACSFLNSAFGLWTERGPGTTAGDMAGISLRDCNIMSQTKACIALHYFRDLHLIGGFTGSYEAEIAAIWVSLLSPTFNDSLWIESMGIESDPTDSPPAILIGSNGSEGVYSDDVYPFNTYTNGQYGAKDIHLNQNQIAYTSTDAAIRVRGSAASITSGLGVNGSRFDTASTEHVIYVEGDVPDDFVLRYDDLNIPKNLISRMRDDRATFLTTSVDANAGNLLNAGWRDMSKGGPIWSGSVAPVTTITNFMGLFGVDLAPGSQLITRMPLRSGAGPITLRANDLLIADYVVLWDTTNDVRAAFTRKDQNADAYLAPYKGGTVAEYARYTNSYGVWRRFVAAMDDHAGYSIDNVAFQNSEDTNVTVTLGYLALYSPNYSSDASIHTASGAEIWSGKYLNGEMAYTELPLTNNWHGSKWTSGYAVRGPFSGAITYDRGTCITNAGNVYLADSTVASGGSAPTHSSGTTAGWAFVATGTAASREFIVTGNSTERTVLNTVKRLTGGTASNFFRGDGVFANIVPVQPTNNGAYVLYVTNGVASWIAHP